MFESRYRFIPTAFALQSPALDAGYADCWAGLKDQSGHEHLDETHDPALRSWVDSPTKPAATS